MPAKAAPITTAPLKPAPVKSPSRTATITTQERERQLPENIGSRTSNNSDTQFRGR
jgi:hypothetical protein